MPNLNLLMYIYTAYAIVVPSMIFHVRLFNLTRWLHRQPIPRIMTLLIRDWFAFTPRWLGAYPIIWLIYFLGLLDLIPYFQGKLATFSLWFSVPVALIAFILA